jgi:selenocysteine-specific elongation factor
LSSTFAVAFSGYIRKACKGDKVFVLGTAGHVDHGKSVLVHALTGIDPDRLREEKERAMTIDLGFAWLTLPSGREIGIVDVPGHERFIKNMLVGVGGIDLALLIIAANEGVMPQTREHLAILDLLEIKRGIVVVTKKDMVDEEWLSLVTMEIEEVIEPTGLYEAPVIAVSALTGEGLPVLIEAIEQLLNSTEPRKDIGRPRLLIDRIFTMSGSGTVVTGTLLDGSLTRGQEVEIIPQGLKSRLRELQTHKAHIDIANPGSRVAANIVGVATSQLKRGDVLTRPGWLIPTTMLDAKLRLLPYLRRPLRHNAMVSFHLGATEVMAKVHILDKEKLEPGDNGWAQLTLFGPVAAVKGDRFIIRSPMETLGGGAIIDPHPNRHRRFRPVLLQSLEAKEKGTVEEVIMVTLEAKQPLEQAALLAQSELPLSEAQIAIEDLVQQKKMVSIGQGEPRLFYTGPGWERLKERATAIVMDYHRRFPVRAGMSKAELASKLKLNASYSTSVMQNLSQDGVLVEEGTVVRHASYRIHLTQEQQSKIETFMHSLAQDPYAPPSDLIPGLDLLNLLIEQRRVVKVSDGVIFAASTYNEMVEKITTYIKERGRVTLAEVRDMFGTSRKYAQAILEHLDNKGITRRVGDERVLK